MTESKGKRVLPVPAFPLTTSRALLEPDDMGRNSPHRKHPKLNETTERIFNFILEHKRRHDGNSPTIREIMTAVGLKSMSVVIYHRNRLVAAGKIRLVGTQHSSNQIEVIGGKWIFMDNVS